VLSRNLFWRGKAINIKYYASHHMLLVLPRGTWIILIMCLSVFLPQLPDTPGACAVLHCPLCCVWLYRTFEHNFIKVTAFGGGGGIRNKVRVFYFFYNFCLKTLHILRRIQHRFTRIRNKICYKLYETREVAIFRLRYQSFPCQ
jgi:hypothetical protein